MKAVAFQVPLPVDDPRSLVDVDLEDPVPAAHDLLVEVHAVSVNPVDTKIRQRSAPTEGARRVLGWDAAGIVRGVGDQVTLFKPGDRVWYAGALARQGSNAEMQVVDERVVGSMPASLGFSAAAALPLTTITAWEMLFERLGIEKGSAHSGESMLIIGAAGGVGSIMTQLARRLTSLEVIGTASRAETRKWLHDLGAQHVLDHTKPLADEFKRAGLRAPKYVVSTTHTDKHYAQIAELIAPQGRFGLIDDPAPVAIDVTALKRKSVSLHWEFMFTRSMFDTSDQIEQHRLLNDVARLVDAGMLRTTLGDHFGVINATNLRRAHALIESGRARGKIVLEGF